MSETTTETYEVSADDRRALKESDTLVLFYRPTGEEGPTWGIRLGREIRLDNVNAERDLARIARAGVWTRTYASDWSIDYKRTIAGDPAQSNTTCYSGVSFELGSASAVKTTIRFDSHIKTALLAIREGDSIVVRFVLGNNSESTNDVGWVRDECYLRVIRKGKLVGDYLIDVYVGPPNSARMAHS